MLAIDVTASFAPLGVVAVPAGDEIAVEVNLLNAGDPIAGQISGSIDFYAFEGGVFDPDEATFLWRISGRASVPDLLNDIFVPIPLNLDAGTYRLGGVLTTNIGDTNPANDTFVSDSFQVVAPDYDLVGAVTATQKYPTALVTGTSVASAVNVVVSNDAGATATIPSGSKVWVEVYARPDGAVDDSQDVLLNTKTTLANVGGLIPGASRTVSVPVVFPGTLAAGQYNLVTLVDASHDLTESDEDNNAAVDPGMITVADAFVDLEPSISAKSVIPTALISGNGTRTSLLVAIRNNGNVAIAKTLRADVTVTAVPEGGGAEVLLGTYPAQKVGGIKAGAMKTLKFKNVLFPPGVESGDYRLRVDVDANNILVEGGATGETNNAATTDTIIAVTKGVFDLLPTITSQTVTGVIQVGVANPKALVRMLITNGGNIALPKGQTAQVTVSLRPAVGDDIELRTVTAKISGLKAGAGKSVTIKSPIPGTLDAGDYALVINVAPIQVLDEVDPDNEVLGGLLQVVV